MARLKVAIVLFLASSVPVGDAFAQGAQSPVCVRLEGQLSLIDRGGDPARAEQIRRYEDQMGKQQGELDRTTSQYRQLGCQSNAFLALFSTQSPQCGPLGNRIQDLRNTLDRVQVDLQRLQGGTDRDAQRQPVIAALAQNNCGPQYQQAAATQRGLFDVFGNQSSGGGYTPVPNGEYQSSSFRTLCVRTCDGYYFPISYQTSPGRFAEDEQTCRSTCPAAETALFTHRNPGEDVAQAVSVQGRPYRDLPNAFKYRKEFTASCSCRAAGQSWSEALAGVKDMTVERGDILVTDERSKAMARPTTDTQGRPIRQDARPAQRAAGGAPSATQQAPSAAGGAAAAADPAADPARAGMRTVGPTFVSPAR